jgi:ABC-type Zn uptake system ZnuABC Zn-binding protein ZnuA
VKASGYGGARVVASKGVKALPGGEHGRYDPHAWQEVANVRIYVANIRDALAAVDAVRAAEYQQRATDYLKQLDALEAGSSRPSKTFRSRAASSPAMRPSAITATPTTSSFSRLRG